MKRKLKWMALENLAFLARVLGNPYYYNEPFVNLLRLTKINQGREWNNSLNLRWCTKNIPKRNLMDQKNKNWANSKCLRMMFHTLHWVVNFVRTTKSQVTILRTPVGRVQFDVFEKFTSARKKCDHLLWYKWKNARWLSRRNASVSRNKGKIAPSRATALN